MSKKAKPEPPVDRCDGLRPAGQSGRIALPVLPGAGPIRASNSGRWRAIALLIVHVLMGAHIVQWLITGRTLSPVEPSESMYTLNLGHVNAGFIFFVAAILATIVFGRFVCGWGCHFIAYQDMAAWAMKKIGIKPKAVRSRFLVLAPLALALYMFVWPTAYRAAMSLVGHEVPWPEWNNHLMTTEFWATFPSIPVAIVSVLIAGFAIVYFLGAKGFCTYACPYGGFFGLVEPVSIGRIRVTDACHHCGHCTAVCTSNVRVHEEVAKFGMVVDPGCMKCMDCVSVCPNDALYFGLGRPALGARPSSPIKARRYTFSLRAELAMAVLGLGTFLACRGMYDVFPMLLTMGFAGIAGFVFVTAGRMLVSPNEKIQSVQLRKGGRFTAAGAGYLVFAVLLFALVAHSGFVKGNAKLGHAALADAGFLVDHWRTAEANWAAADGAQRAGVDRAQRYLERAYAWAPMVKAELCVDLVRVLRLKGRNGEAEAVARRLVAAHPDYAHANYVLGSLLAQAGLRDEAIASFKAALVHQPEHHPARQDLLAELTAGGRVAEVAELWPGLLAHDLDHGDFAVDVANELMSVDRFVEAAGAYGLALRLDGGREDARVGRRLALVQAGRPDEAVRMYEEEAIRRPSDAKLAVEFAELLTAMGRTQDAYAQAKRAVELEPRSRGGLRVLGYALAGLERAGEGVEAYRLAVQANPGDAELAIDFARFLVDLSAYVEAEGEARRGVTLSPQSATGHLILGDALLAQGRFPEAIESIERGIAINPAEAEPHFSLAFAHANLRQFAEAEAAVRKAIDLKPEDAVYRDLLVKVLQAQGRAEEAKVEEDVLRGLPKPQPGS